MNMFLVFYIGIPVLAIIAGLISKFNNRTLTMVFNILMLVALLTSAIWVFTGHHGWIHILSFIGLTIFGNIAGVTLTGKWKR